jgi:hypothetical protein
MLTVRAQKPFNLVLDTINVPLSDLEVKIVDEKGKHIPYALDDSALNKTSIVFTPPAAGKLKVECLMRGQPIEGSPLPITVSTLLGGFLTFRFSPLLLPRSPNSQRRQLLARPYTSV